ncbi:protein translocase subunit SecD [Patescibacteria group bacterium]
MTQSKKLLIIGIITTLAIFIDVPENIPVNINQGPININTTIHRPPINVSILGKTFYRDLKVKQGLDLQGGTQVLLRANMENIAQEDHQDALDSSKEIISRRIDLFGINEAVVQTSVVEKDYRIIVELPGVSDVNQALDLIGATAQLEFRELLEEKKATDSATLLDFQKTDLTGKNLKKSRVEFDPNTGQPVVSLEFDEDGATLFEEITTRNVGHPVAIFLDQYPVTTPIVNGPISGGKAVISGQFDTNQAKNLSIQLNAGALPVPIEIIEQRNIGATLGQESVQKSITAGGVGLIMVMLFMFLYYGRLGLIANIGLIIYGLITLAIYKLLPVTLTLPGLAGFILSVGMAVDSNILVFERMKEELRLGKKWQVAMELGFGRAWDSIKDANVATLITAFILFNPLNWSLFNTSGMIRGFALTLALGIFVSLFTGIFVTRTLLRALYKGSKEKR